jgi:hypothetical protein
MTEIARVHIVCERPTSFLSPTRYRWSVAVNGRSDSGYAGWRWTARRAAAKAARNLAQNWGEETYDLKVEL